MNPVDRMRVQRDAEDGDASAQRLLDLVTALETAIALTEGVGTARAMLGEHDDVYGETIDEMAGTIVFALKDAVDCQTWPEFLDYIGGYMPGGLGVDEESEGEASSEPLYCKNCGCPMDTPASVCKKEPACLCHQFHEKEGRQ